MKENKYTYEDLLKIAFMIDDGYRQVTTNNFNAVELVENIIENGLPKEEIEEETVSITYDMIKRSIGWSRFCYVTGGNHYAISEFGDYDKNYTFDVKLSHAIELKFILGD